MSFKPTLKVIITTRLKKMLNVIGFDTSNKYLATTIKKILNKRIP